MNSISRSTLYRITGYTATNRTEYTTSNHTRMNQPNNQTPKTVSYEADPLVRFRRADDSLHHIVRQEPAHLPDVLIL